MTVQTSVIMSVNAPVDKTFDVATGFDPSQLIRRFGPFPGIEKVDGHTGPWSEIGQTRIHTLSDKTSVREELTGFTKNFTYAYDLNEFTGPMAKLARDGRAEWHFTQLAADRTQIDWTYFFNATNGATEPILWLLIKTWWPGYLRSALSRVKNKAETLYARNAPSF